jgi:hypothetical protein
MTTLTEAPTRFQCDRDTIVSTLDALQDEWTALGITTPVMDETGEIDPDAEYELLQRLP